MPKEIVVYRGWIGAKEMDYAELLRLGVEIHSNWNPIGAFDHCSMTTYVYRKFVEVWKGRGVWGLIGKKEMVYEPVEGDEDIPF